jgi:hypothetical protein
MGASPEVKAAAMKKVMAGLKSGAIRIHIKTTCLLCKKEFKTDRDYENHLINGKFIDPKTNKLRRLCPGPYK